jgi:hypothetical protein
MKGLAVVHRKGMSSILASFPGKSSKNVYCLLTSSLHTQLEQDEDLFFAIVISIISLHIE